MGLSIMMLHLPMGSSGTCLCENSNEALWKCLTAIQKIIQDSIINSVSKLPLPDTGGD